MFVMFVMFIWHAKLKNWHADTFIGTLARKNEKLARKNEKLARFWHVGTLTRRHVDHAGTYAV